MLIWGEEAKRRTGERGHAAVLGVASWCVLLSAAAAVLGCIVATHPVEHHGVAAVRALEQGTGVSFGGRPPASPDIAVVEIGPPMARRIAGDTLDMTFAVPGRRDPTRLLYFAIRWVHEAPVAITAW